MTIRKIFLSGLTVCAIFLSQACNNSGKGSKATADSINKANQPVNQDDAEFMTKAAMINMEEIELGNMAQEQAASSRVKDFGKMLVNDHSQLNSKVRMLASRKNIALPDSINQEIKDAKSDLRDASNFDEDFIDKMVKGHKKAIDVFQKEINSASDSDIKALATSALPQLQMHLDSAQSIQNDLK